MGDTQTPRTVSVRIQGAMNEAKCEPPPELRDKDGWHWLLNLNQITYDAFLWDHQGWWVIKNWTLIPPQFLATTHRYHAPIPAPPAEPYQSPQAETADD